MNNRQKRHRRRQVWEEFKAFLCLAMALLVVVLFFWAVIMAVLHIIEHRVCQQATPQSYNEMRCAEIN